MSASATAPHGAIVGKGLSSSTTVKESIAVAWYDAWAETRGLPKLAASTAPQFCRKLHIQQLAHYAVHTYKKADGNHLSVSTTGNYVSAVMNAAARQFGDAAVVDDAGTTTKEFFAVLGGRGSTLAPQNNWYMQMLAGMRHAGTQREIEAGNELAADTPGLSRDAVVAIAKAYFSTNKKQSTKDIRADCAGERPRTG